MFLLSNVNKIDGTKAGGAVHSGLIVSQEGEGSLLVIWPDGTLSLENIEGLILEPEEQEESDVTAAKVFSLVPSDEDPVH